MTASLTAFVVADRAASPAARFGRLGRLAAAGTLVVVWRSGAVSRGAAVLIVVFFIVDAPFFQPLSGHLIALVAALWSASTILRARPAAP